MLTNYERNYFTKICQEKMVADVSLAKVQPHLNSDLHKITFVYGGTQCQ